MKFKWINSVLGNKASCINIMEDLWGLRKKINLMETNLEEVKRRKKALKPQKEGEIDIHLNGMNVALNNAIEVVNSIAFDVNKTTILNCGIYYGFWKNIKELYLKESERVSGNMKRHKKIHEQVKKHISKTHLGKIKKVNKKLVNMLHKDLLREQTIVKEKMSIELFNLDSMRHLDEKIRVKSEQVKKDVEEVTEMMKKMAEKKKEERTENEVKVLEKKLTAGIKDTHIGIKESQQFLEKIEKKEKEIENNLDWMQLSLTEPDRKKYFYPLVKRNKELKKKVQTELYKTCRNMISELNEILNA
ncbi:hypothetical protein JXA85_05465 [Candidatus Woesearchaeota archaeon]|nr:hypothetical protein [Candidatus Woesearchaeota archaeon]